MHNRKAIGTVGMMRTVALAGMLLLSVCGPTSAGDVSAQSQSFGAQIAGTWFLQQSSDSYRILTILPDGQWFATDSSQLASVLVVGSRPFSNQQGVWQQTDFKTIRGKMLDFVYPATADQKLQTTMATYELTFGNGYTTVTGTATLRFYGGNPLVPDAQPVGDAITITFTGQRVNAD